MYDEQEEEEEITHEQLPYAERVLYICACGAPMYPALNAEGKRVGVTHETIEDDDVHNLFFSSLRVEIV